MESVRAGENAQSHAGPDARARVVDTRNARATPGPNASGLRMAQERPLGSHVAQLLRKPAEVLLVSEGGDTFRAQPLTMLQPSSEATGSHSAKGHLVVKEPDFRTLFSILPDAVLVSDPQGNLVMANPMAETLLGSGERQLLGESLLRSNLFSKVDRLRVASALARSARGETANMGEFVLDRRDGRRLQVEITVAPCKGQSRVVLWLLQDLTERKRTAQLEALNLELEASSYSVSHDLRGPVRHIAGFADLLVATAGTAFPDKANHCARQIQESTRRMATLIEELLVFARTARAELKVDRLELIRLVEEAREHLAPDMQARRVQWKVDPLPGVHGDRALLRQVLVNLLSNALKYTRPRDPAQIEVGCSQTPSEVVLFVRDNGVGFDMRYVDRLFGVFQRLHSVETFEGAGIGLALVRRIVNRHGGRTWAEGAPDQGATFYVALPKFQISNPL